MVIVFFCQQGISQVYLGLLLSHWDQPKKNSVSEQWVIFRGSTLFLAALGLCGIIGISTLNFGLFSTKLGGTKITQNDNGPGTGPHYEETAVFSGKKCFFGQKCISTQKTPKIS